MAIAGVGSGANPAMMAYVQGAGGTDRANQARKDDAAVVQRQQATKAAEAAAKAPPKPTGNNIDVSA